MAYLITEIGPTNGFHPMSSTTIHLPGPHLHYNQCSLYLYHTLPPLIFVDTHELAQRNDSYTFRHWGSRDLEKPVHALPDDGTELLVDVRWSESDSIMDLNTYGEERREIHVEVPMHMRYGAPRETASSTSNSDAPEQGSYERIRVDWPLGFLSCPSTSPLKTHKASISLPPHILSSLSPQSNDILIPIPPHSNFSSSETFTTLYLPLGNTKDLAFVEPLTALTILACCFWVFRMAFKTFSRLDANSNRNTRPKTS